MRPAANATRRSATANGCSFPRVRGEVPKADGDAPTARESALIRLAGAPSPEVGRRGIVSGIDVAWRNLTSRSPIRIAVGLALAASAFAASAAPVTYRIDPAHTDVIAHWNHLGFSNPTAHFGQVEGTIVYDADNVAASSVEVTIPMSGLNSHVARFDEHLRNADFFDAVKFPVATFRSTSVEAAGEGRLKVAGSLTIKDITRPVVLDVVLNKAAPHPRHHRPTIGFDATASVLRSAFGLGRGAPAVSDEVKLRITTEAQAAAD